MTGNKRPLSVTIVACLYLLVGAVGFVAHGREILARHAFQYDDALVELTEIVAIVSGAFMLRGHNWARWLAIAWMAFHVIISAFDSFSKFAIHAFFLSAIALFLFRPAAAGYFRSTRAQST